MKSCQQQVCRSIQMANFSDQNTRDEEKNEMRKQKGFSLIELFDRGRESS